MEMILPFGSEIPDRYTQYGRNISPHIEFEDIHDDAKTLVLFFENETAPASISVHWIIWNIPAHKTTLPEAIARVEHPETVKGAVQGNNDFGILGYQGPRMFPEEEKYVFTSYALDTKLNTASGSRKESIEADMRGSVLDKAEKQKGYTS